VDSIHLNVPEFQVGNRAFPRGQAQAARGEEPR